MLREQHQFDLAIVSFTSSARKIAERENLRVAGTLGWRASFLPAEQRVRNVDAAFSRDVRMMIREQKSRLLRLATLGLTTVLVGLANPGHAQTGPFAGLAGAWTGTGQVQLKDGGNERIRCRANYTVDESGAGLKQTLNCASDSYRFSLTTNVNASGQNLSGSWSERDRNLNGTVSGRVSAGHVNALVEANGFAASLSVQTNGNRQTIAIKSENTDLRGVNITLNR